MNLKILFRRLFKRSSKTFSIKRWQFSVKAKIVIAYTNCSFLSSNAIQFYMDGADGSEKYENNMFICTDYGHFTLDTGIVQCVVQKFGDKFNRSISTGQGSWGEKAPNEIRLNDIIDQKQDKQEVIFRSYDDLVDQFEKDTNYLKIQNDFKHFIQTKTKNDPSKIDKYIKQLLIKLHGFQANQGLNNRGFGLVHNFVIQGIQDSGIFEFIDVQIVKSTLIKICQDQQYSIDFKFIHADTIIGSELQTKILNYIKQENRVCESIINGQRILPFDVIQNFQLGDINIILKQELVFQKIYELIQENTNLLYQQVTNIQARMHLHYGFVHPIQLSFCGSSIQNPVFSKILYKMAKATFKDEADDDMGEVQVATRPVSAEEQLKSAGGCLEGATNYLRLTADRDSDLNRWLQRTIQIPMAFVIERISPSQVFRYLIEVNSKLPPLSSLVGYSLSNLDSCQPELGNIINSMYLTFYNGNNDTCIGQQFSDIPVKDITIAKKVEVSIFEFLDALPKIQVSFHGQHFLFKRIDLFFYK